MTMTTAPSAPTRTSGGGISGALASEWTKLWSVRSTWWSLAGGLALVTLLAASLGFDASQPPPDEPLSAVMLPVQDAAALGMVLAQFPLIALATLTVTSEFATGSMLSTLQWEPRRGRVLLAKLVVLAPVAFVAAAAMMLLAALAADLTAAEYGVFVASNVIEAALRTGLYVALAAVLSAGIGFVLRSTAGTLTTVFLMMMLLPTMLAPLDFEILSTVGQSLPGAAGMQFAGSAQMVGLGDVPYSATEGLVLLLAWSAAAAAGGYAVFRRRDA